MKIDTSTIEISYAKDGKRLNDTKAKGYVLYIPFYQQPDNNFQFDFKFIGGESKDGINKDFKTFYFKELKEEYKIILEQKNPDTSFGWSKPITTDSLIFKRIRL